MEKQPLAATPGMFSVGMERTINLGNYENIRIGFVESFARSETDPHDAYVKIKAMLDNWIHELPPIRPPPKSTETDLNPPIHRDSTPPKLPEAPPIRVKLVEGSAKRNALIDAIAPYAHRVQVTETSTAIIVRTRGQLERETWGDIDTLVRGQGGSWRGTKDGLPGKEVHWEIPK